MSVINLNINRLNHLLALYRLSSQEFLRLLNDGKKKKLTETDVFSNEIKISALKRIDAVFCKGLSYYVNPENPIKSNEESIFFRKEKFNIDLNLTAKQVVNKFENEKISFSTLEKLSDIESKRIFPIYKISDQPFEIAKAIRNKLHKVTNSPKRDGRRFLREFIAILAEFNILVFEYVEGRNKKLKANIDGFYITPNVIVIKWQKYPKREIFTLLHELGHYLLNNEDIDDTTITETLISTTNKVEQWCNEFAFGFLIGQYITIFDSILISKDDKEFYTTTIDSLAKLTHLSTLALYTRLYYTNKISEPAYNKVVSDIKAAILAYEANEKVKQELKNLKLVASGKKLIAPLPKPIMSPFYTNTLQIAFYNGFLNEIDFCRKLHIKPNQIEAYI